MAARGRQDSSRPGLQPVLGDLRQGRISPLYLLHGPEIFLRDQLVRAIRQAVLPGEATGFNHDLFHWGECKAADVAAAANTLPFMSSRRLVEVRGLAFSARGEGGAPQAQDAEISILLGLLERPPETAVLLFVAEKADMRLALFQRMREAGVALLMETPSERDLPGWIHLQAEGLGFSVSPDGARLLVDVVEPSLSRLRAELEKLAAYVGPGREAGEEEVREVVGRSRVEAVYELGNALSAGNTPGALRLLRHLYETKEPPFLLGVLRNQVRKWVIAKAASAKGRKPDEMASLLRMPSFAAERLAREVQGVGARFLRSLYGKLLDVDRRIKRSADDRHRREAMELLILEMGQDAEGFARGRRAPSRRPGAGPAGR